MLADDSAASGVFSLERWDGRRRHTVFDRDDLSGLSDIAAVGARDVWAVGGDAAPLVVHWDGRGQRLVRTPFASLPDTNLTSVCALSSTDIWAAGNRLIARYSC